MNCKQMLLPKRQLLSHAGSSCHNSRLRGDSRGTEARKRPVVSVASLGRAPPAKKVIIVGGGPAGLSAAIALRRIGVDAQVYERRTQLPEGYLVALAANGLHALSQISSTLVPKMAAAGVPNPVGQMIAPDGKVLRQMVLPEGVTPIDGIYRVHILWMALNTVLGSELPAECLHLSHSLLDVIQADGEGVTATFTTPGGTTVEARGDLLVGADGIWSRVREVVAGVGPDCVRDQGRSLFRGTIDRNSVGHELMGSSQTLLSPAEGRLVLFGDVGGGRLYVSLAVVDSFRPDVPRHSSSGQEAMQRVQELFRGMPLAEEAMRVMEPSRLLERRVLEGPLLDRWVYGHVVLIGDAAHAMVPASGQGANIAFEDAWELARFLDHYSSLPEALQHFEAARIPRLRFIVNKESELGRSSYSRLNSGQPLGRNQGDPAGKAYTVENFKGSELPPVRAGAA